MKKNKMKKIFGCALVCLMPLVMLTGCGELSYEKTATNKTATDFLSSVSSEIQRFSNNIDTTINEALPLGDKSEFDVKTLDDEAHNKLNSKILDVAQKKNVEGLIATSIYQIASDKLQQSFFDLSFLANNDLTQKNQLEQFFVQAESKIKDGEQIVYKHQFVGNEYQNFNLVPVASNLNLVDDNIDSIIETWGNNLQFKVTSDGFASKRISIMPVFTVPSKDEVELSLKDKFTLEDYKEIHNVDNDTTVITVNYTDGSYALTKDVEFVVYKSNGEVKKRVSVTGKGNYSYSYSLEVKDEDGLNILGDYTVRYDNMNSFISCKIQHQNEPTTTCEYFKTQMGEVIGRLTSTKTGERGVVSLIINRDLQTGFLKYNYQKGTNLSSSKYLQDEVLSKALCEITDEERTLATTKKNVEILNYTIDENGIFVDWANKVKEPKE